MITALILATAPGLIFTGVAANPCALDRAHYTLASDSKVTARIVQVSRPNVQTTLTVTHAGHNLQLSFRISNKNGEVTNSLTHEPDVFTRRTDALGRPDMFQNERVIFLASDGTARTITSDAPAPAGFYTDGVFRDLYYASALREGEDRIFVPAGMFILTRCEQ